MTRLIVYQYFPSVYILFRPCTLHGTKFIVSLKKVANCRTQSSSQLERGHWGWRYDESSFWHAGRSHYQCWGCNLRNFSSCKITICYFHRQIVLSVLQKKECKKTGWHEIENWSIAQAKESDPEHSVTVSGLSYIALVALHRLSWVSRDFQICLQITNLINHSAQSQFPMYPMCSWKMRKT